MNPGKRTMKTCIRDIMLVLIFLLLFHNDQHLILNFPSFSKCLVLNVPDINLLQVIPVGKVYWYWYKWETSPGVYELVFLQVNINVTNRICIVLGVLFYVFFLFVWHLWVEIKTPGKYIISISHFYHYFHAVPVDTRFFFRCQHVSIVPKLFQPVKSLKFFRSTGVLKSVFSQYFCLVCFRHCNRRCIKTLPSLF